MNLSIFSFKSKNTKNNRLIFNSVFICMILFFAYDFYISFHPPRVEFFDNQFKFNISIAQRYLYDYSESPIVIVGSSLSATLNNEMLLKTGAYNLSFKGSGPMTGLSLIAKENLKPNVVLIEINSILIGVNEELIQKVTSPISFRMKRLFPALREEYQPVNVFINLLLNLSRRTFSSNVFDQGRFKKAFQIKKKKFAELPDQTILLKNIEKLSSLVVRLGENGINFVFFEMPIHTELRNSIRLKMIRSAVEAKFPKRKYKWINDLSVSKRETSDGTHITSEAAVRVTDHLVAKLRSIGK